MNLATARGWVRQFARNAQDSSIYSDPDIDRALQACLSRFCRETAAISVKCTQSLAIGDSFFQVQHPDPGLGNPLDTPIMPEQLINIYFTGSGKQLTIIDNLMLSLIVANNRVPDEWGGILDDDLAGYGAIDSSYPSTGLNGFTVSFWPSSAVVQTMVARVWIPFGPIWTPGNNVTDIGALPVSFNLPDHWLQQILPLGPPAMLQLHEPENGKQAAAKWAAYLELEKSFANAGSLSVAIGRRAMQM